MFLYPHPVYPRKGREVAFKRLYNLVMVLNFAAWIIVFMDFVSRVDNTFEGYWGVTTFKYYEPLSKVLRGCNTTMSISFFNFHAQTEMTEASSPYHFVQVTAAIRAIFIVHGCSLVFDFLAKIMFALNIRHIRIRGMHIPANHIFLLFMLCLSCCTIGLVVETQSMRDLLDDYVSHCTDRFKTTNEAEYVKAEQDSKTVFGTAVEALLWLTVVNLSVYVIAFVFLMTHSFTEPTARILKLDFPWERGILCKPNKPVLVSYCREREDWEEQVMKIDVDNELKKKSMAAALEYNPTAVPDIPVDIVTNPQLPPEQHVMRPMTDRQIRVYPGGHAGMLQAQELPPHMQHQHQHQPHQQQQPPVAGGGPNYGYQPTAQQQQPSPEELMQGDTDADPAAQSGPDGGHADGLEASTVAAGGGEKKEKKRVKVKRKKTEGGATTGEEDGGIAGRDGERSRKKKGGKKKSSGGGEGDADENQPDQFDQA